MRDLFAAAREDAPPPVVRDEVWGRVAAATTVAAGTAAATKSVLPVGKGLALAAAAGAASVAVVVFLLAPSLSPFGGTPLAKRSCAYGCPGTHDVVHGGGARLAEPQPRGRAEVVPDRGVASVPASPLSPAPVPTAEPTSELSDLAEEARLVTEARAALVRGEPERALSLARATRRLGARALEPEELALESRALRALDRADEALATELTLRRRYPNHALSR